MTLDTLQQHYNQLLQAEADAKYWFDKLEAQIRAEYEQRKAADEAEKDRLIKQSESQFAEAKKAALQRAAEVLARAGTVAADWADPRWQTLLDGQVANQLPTGVRVGIAAKAFPHLGINHVPLVVPLLNTGHLLIISQSTAKSQARLMLRNIATRLLLTTPPQNARFTFIDPIGLGANFPFGLVPKTIRGESILSEQDEIANALRDISIDIRKANEGERSEKIHFCMVADFPNRFNMDMLTRVATIGEQGVKANTHLILHVDSDYSLPDGFDPSPLLNASSIIYAEAAGFRANVGSDEYAFQPDGLPDDARLQSLLSTLKDAS